MITKDQIENLSKTFQIDKFTIFREYLQLTFLSYLYQQREGSKFFFKGGTALRLLFGSPRFSEDLDFSTICSEAEITDILERIERDVAREFPGLEINSLYSGREGIRFRVRYSSSDFKYPLNLRLDFHRVSGVEDEEISTLTTRFPILIFPQVFHLSMGAILEEKLAALETRTKGRDIFDIWFLLSKGTKISKSKIDMVQIAKKIESFPDLILRKDLGKFLPRGQKGIIPSLKSTVLSQLSTS